MTVVLVIMKMAGCPACERLSSKLHTIENGMRKINGMEDMTISVFEVATPGFDIRTVPYALRTIDLFPMLFLVPAHIWDTVMRSPNSNIPLEGNSFMFNGNWVGSKPTFTPGPPKYSHNDAESYIQWARDTMKERKFSRIHEDKNYEAIPHRISPGSSSSPASSSSSITSVPPPHRSSSSSSSSSHPKACRIIRYTTKK